MKNMIKALSKYKLMPGTQVIDSPTSILLRHRRMPGDIIAMTPLVRDLKKTYGNMIKIYIDTPQGQDVWKYNPYIEQGKIEKYDLSFDLDYIEAVENQSRGLHMSEGFRQDFMKQSGIHIIPSNMWPDIFLNEKEINSFRKENYQTICKSFWVVCPGNKSSCQVKIWPRSRWAEFFAQNEDYIFIQIGQSKHGHKPFISHDNVYDMIDKTTLRELFMLIYFSQGTIGYISLHMHTAAAFRKPSFILAGGRESSSFFRYENHIIVLGTGYYPCCQLKGCFKGKEKTVKEICGEWCFNEGKEVIPSCMDFTSEQLYRAFSYYNRQMDHLKNNMPNCIIRDEPKKEKYTVKLNDNKISAIKEEFINKNKGLKSMWSTGDMVNKPLFRMICNTCCYGGGERTAIRLMHLMKDRGYDIELVPATGDFVHHEFIQQLPEGTQIRDILYPHPDEADIVFFQANDTLYRLYKTNIQDWIKPWFMAAKKRIIGVNYMVWGLKKYDADHWICQSEKLRNDLINIFKNKNQLVIDRNGNELVKIRILKPPADLSRFLSFDYSVRDYCNITLIRHSSQGDRKYANNIIEQIEIIKRDNRKIQFFFMPGPSCFHCTPSIIDFDKNHIENYNFDSLSVECFLEKGNVFWYWVPKEKFIESGCNAVLEAMAAGLPVLCNDNGGLVDIIDNEVGWMCRTEQDMYDAIKSMTMEEIKEKGARARERVQEIVSPDKWVKTIIGTKNQ